MLSKKTSGYVLVLSAGIAAVLLSLRWFEVRVGTGGFFSGIVVGVVLSFGALFAFIASAQRKVAAVRRERLRVKLPEAPVPGGETAIYHWKVRKLDGTLMSMDDVMRRVVFLNFWSTMCGPCVVEMSNIERLHAILAPEGVVFMCVASDQDIDHLRKWVADNGVTIPVFALVDDRMPTMFDSEFVPATYIIAADSRIAFKHEGAAEWDHPRVVAYLRGLLMESDILAAGAEPSKSSPAA
jgi:thiol-disulfide isomerase/thioredoxin